VLEDAAVRDGVVGGTEEIVEVTACKHERQEQMER
jgi:hypothetical protein